MPLQDCTIYTDQDRREVRPHGTIEFPCAGYDSVYSVDSVSRIPWHWHEELEVIYLYSGTLEIRVPGRSLRMNAGDSLMIKPPAPAGFSLLYSIRILYAALKALFSI